VKAELLSHTDLSVFPEVALVLFATVFCAAILWIFRPGARAAYAARSAMPLDDGRALSGMRDLGKELDHG
jgi:cbb3-type cytochrome oxidase subunit 3